MIHLFNESENYIMMIEYFSPISYVFIKLALILHLNKKVVLYVTEKKNYYSYNKCCAGNSNNDQIVAKSLLFHSFFI